MPLFPGDSGSKESASVQETQVRSLGQEDPLEKGMAIHSTILAWRIPWTEEPGGLQPGGRKESGMTERLTFRLCLFTQTFFLKKGFQLSMFETIALSNLSKYSFVLLYLFMSVSSKMKSGF